jgi:DNA-binding IclR family transcriptional regulator
VAGVSAPVFGDQGQLLGALTLTLPTQRFQAEFKKVVKLAAELLSLRLKA